MSKVESEKSHIRVGLIKTSKRYLPLITLYGWRTEGDEGKSDVKWRESEEWRRS